MKYNKKADEFLNQLYFIYEAETPDQKYDVLELELDIVPGTQSFSHNPTIQQKISMLEYELLNRNGLIELTLV